MNRDSSIVRVGIAGLGRAGWNIHAATIAPLKDRFAIVAVSDPDAERQREAQDRFGCRAYGGFAQLLDDGEVELVVVAAPSHLHAGYTIAALEAGKHVLVEKPMAGSLAEADTMVAAARDTGQILTVNQNYRNMPDLARVREVIASGKLGRIVQIRIAWHSFSRRWDWQTLREYGGGMLSNSGPHVVDRALLLMGDAEPEVFCHLECTPLYAGDAESHVRILLRAPGAPLLDIELTSACAYAQEEWLVMGTQGGLTGSKNRLRWRYFDPDALPPLTLSREPTSDRSYNREDLPWQEETFEVEDDIFQVSNTRVYLDLHATLREGAPLAITPESVRRQMAVLARCRELCPL